MMLRLADRKFQKFERKDLTKRNRRGSRRLYSALILGGSFVMTLPRAFKSIRLHLARSKEFPKGSPQHGYEFIAPLDATGHIDGRLWRAHPDACTVYRFWGTEQPEAGRLVHRPGGAESARWVFDYDLASADDDETGHRFGAHLFRPGEYVTLRHGATDHTFRVVSVEAAPTA
jgi:hypothetical protein